MEEILALFGLTKSTKIVEWPGAEPTLSLSLNDATFWEAIDRVNG